MAMPTVLLSSAVGFFPHSFYRPRWDTYVPWCKCPITDSHPNDLPFSLKNQRSKILGYHFSITNLVDIEHCIPTRLKSERLSGKVLASSGALKKTSLPNAKNWVSVRM
jgi:hypothetical protein